MNCNKEKKISWLLEEKLIFFSSIISLSAIIHLTKVTDHFYMFGLTVQFVLYVCHLNIQIHVILINTSDIFTPTFSQINNYEKMTKKSKKKD